MPLSALRAELDRIDREILLAAARRGEIVREIARVKGASGGERPLFDRAREREVRARAKTLAAEVGLDEGVARDLMRTLLDASHGIQEEEAHAPAAGGAGVEADRAGERAASVLVVGGAGRMGRLLVDVFGRRGHSVGVLEAGDGRDVAEAVGGADVVVIAVPMAIAAQVAAGIGPHVRADALLCDVNSLKGDVCAAMERTCRGEVLGLHPMFGPTVRSLRRQKVLVCPVRPGPRATWLRRELSSLGVELIDTDPVTHDRMMAVIQVLVHYSTLVMGEALRDTGISVEESLRFTSPIYRLELAFVGRLFAQSPDLYAEIEMTNPHGADVRRRFRAAAERLEAAIAAGDHDAFRAMFKAVSGYFEGFADEAMALSDGIIEALVREA